MEASHRYRLLIYFVALVLGLSVCFAFAEEPHGASQTLQEHSSRLLFQTTPGHSSFMPTLQQSFVAPVEASIAAPVITVDRLNQISANVHKGRGFWHGGGRHKPSLILNHSQATADSHGNNTFEGAAVSGFEGRPE